MGEGMVAAGQPPRRQRADAQRNVAALLQAAAEVFITSGVDAPAKQIADLAGVGVGTLYRHFPQRSDLVAAVLEHEIDALPGYFFFRLEPVLGALLAAATATGEIRTDVSAKDLLRAVAHLCMPLPDEGFAYNQRMVGVLVDGLRTGV